MTSQAFEKGFEALIATFPGMNFNVKLFWEMLQDLDGQFFLMAIWKVIKDTKEIYPGTNIIAIIRCQAQTLKDEYTQNNTLKLETENEKERIERWKKEAVPMPEDCKEAFRNLGLKI